MGELYISFLWFLVIGVPAQQYFLCLHRGVPAVYFFGCLLKCARWRGVPADVENCVRMRISRRTRIRIPGYCLYTLKLIQPLSWDLSKSYQLFAFSLHSPVFLGLFFLKNTSRVLGAPRSYARFCLDSGKEEKNRLVMRSTQKLVWSKQTANWLVG